MVIGKVVERNSTDVGKISILKSEICKRLNRYIPVGEHDKAKSMVAIRRALCPLVYVSWKRLRGLTTKDSPCMHINPKESV
jgi:hypothetical protein